MNIFQNNCIWNRE